MRSALLAASLSVLAVGSAVMADPFTITWYTIDGGGGTSSGGSFTLSGTIGQPDAGAAMTGGSFSLTGGFWAGISAPAPVGCSPADVLADGVVDGSDFVAFINSFAIGDVTIDPVADINRDGIVDGNDFVAFINAFAIGC